MLRPHSPPRWTRARSCRSSTTSVRPSFESWTMESSVRAGQDGAQAKKKQHVIHLKEVKYRPGIEEHDFMTKTRHAREFLQEGNKVKVTLMFRGRQIAHPELGRQVVNRVATELADVAKIESDPKFEGKFMTMILAPK